MDSFDTLKLEFSNLLHEVVREVLGPIYTPTSFQVLQYGSAYLKVNLEHSDFDLLLVVEEQTLKQLTGASF